MTAEVRRFAEPEAFLQRAEAFLFEREALHTLVITAVGRLRRGTEADWRDGYLATVERDGDVLLAAAQVPDLSLALTEAVDHTAVELLAADVAETRPALPGVNGPADTVEAFAAAWSAGTGRPSRVTMRTRLFACEWPSPPADVPGRLRAARALDREMLLDWLDAFSAEAVPHQPRDRSATAEAVDRLLADREPRLHVWEDEGRLVSMAVNSQDPPASPRVSGVYTPPEFRRRGYAAACVAALTARLLESGHRRVLLFTDLANPISNRVYQRIGYVPLADHSEHCLGGAG